MRSTTTDTTTAVTQPECARMYHLFMSVQGIDLAIQTGLRGDFEQVLKQVTKSSCYSSVDFSAANRSAWGPLRGTLVEAHLGYDDDSAAQVVHDPQFISTFELGLRAVSEAFENVLVMDRHLEVVTVATQTTTAVKSTTLTPTPTTTTSVAMTKRCPACGVSSVVQDRQSDRTVRQPRGDAQMGCHVCACEPTQMGCHVCACEPTQPQMFADVTYVV